MFAFNNLNIIIYNAFLTIFIYYYYYLAIYFIYRYIYFVSKIQMQTSKNFFFFL